MRGIRNVHSSELTSYLLHTRKQAQPCQWHQSRLWWPARQETQWGVWRGPTRLPDLVRWVLLNHQPTLRLQYPQAQQMCKTGLWHIPGCMTDRGYIRWTRIADDQNGQTDGWQSLQDSKTSHPAYKPAYAGTPSSTMLGSLSKLHVLGNLTKFG